MLVNREVVLDGFVTIGMILDGFVTRLMYMVLYPEKAFFHGMHV
jgi:hypothetical protein